VANRVVSAQEVSGGIEYYGYAADNKQVYRLLPNGSQEFTLYGVHGEKLGVYSPGYNSYTGYFGLVPLRTSIYFAGKTIWSDNVAAYRDRLGTNRANGARFMPFGDEITSTTNDREKFATYTRDSYTGLDYADQRFYASTYGNFTTPDPSMKNVDYSNPMTWNAYNYANGDPINGNDPTGLDVDIPITGGGSPTSCLNSVFTPWLNANTNISLGNNFGNFANTGLGALALTSFFEDEGAISSLYSNIDQVMLNRYWLDQSNPTLAKNLGLPSGSFASVVEQSSAVWSNGNLQPGFENQIISIMNGSGTSSGCTQFMSSLNVANGAVGQLNNPGSTVAGSTLQGSGWYWFYTGSGNNPVNLNYWNTNINQWNGTNWYFEQLIGPKPAPRRPPPPRNPRRPGPQDEDVEP
jgi:RHS repeat-associated protein